MASLRPSSWQEDRHMCEQHVIIIMAGGQAHV